MAGQEPLLQSDNAPQFSLRFPSLAFVRQWAKGQPLRETESLDYEPIYNKVYFSRRKQPDRRFYGYDLAARDVQACVAGRKLPVAKQASAML